MVSAYIIVMLRLVFYRYDMMRFETGWDLAIFDQATWLISRGQTPFVSVRGLHILADHFSLLLYFLAPLSWLWESPKRLLVAQTLALALGALPLFALARERLESAWWGALFAGVYLLYPMMQWANIYEFHPDTFCVPFLLSAFLCLRRRRWALYFLCLMGVACTKENAGLTIGALGVWVWWRIDRRIGWLSLGAGALAVIAALGTIRYFNGGTASGYYLLYAKYGNGLPDVARGVLTQPALVWSDVSSPEKRVYLGHLLRPVMFLPLLSPGLSLAALPSLMTNMLSSRSWMSSQYAGYYSSLLIPFIFAASIESCRWLQAMLGKRWVAIVGVNLLVWTLMDAPQSAVWQKNHDIAGASPARVRILQQRWDAAQSAIRRIPAGASVSAQILLIPYLSHRTRLYTFPNPFWQQGWGNTLKARRELEGMGVAAQPPPHLQAQINAANVEYVALCPATERFPSANSSFETCVLAVFKSPSYAIISIDRHVVLLRRHADRRAGWRLLSKVSGTPIHGPHDVEKAFWKWLAIQPELASEDIDFQ